MAPTPGMPTRASSEDLLAREAGWYEADGVVGGLRWWDGQKWTDSVAVPIVRPEPPSQRRVSTFLVLAALSLALTVAFGTWAYADLERNCRRDSPSDVDYCVNDASMGVDMIGMFGFIAFGVFLALGIGGLRRRRSARRAGLGSAPEVEDGADGVPGTS